MKRVIGWVVGTAVVVLLLLWPVVVYGDLGDEEGPPPTGETTISSYVADFDVADDGDLAVTETLTVNFPNPGKHGIFRFWDTEDPNAPDSRRTPHDVEVTMDGHDVPFEVSRQGGGRYRNAKIGDPDSTVSPGDHVYEISYTIDGVLEPGTDGSRTQFYWNLVPGGWSQAITAADLTVHLPAAAEHVRCAVGTGTDGCTADGEGTATLHVSAADLPPRTSVTLKAGLDLATPPAGGVLPWRPALDGVVGTDPLVLGIVLALSLVAAVAGYLLARGTRETNPQLPLMYAPPEGIGPAQAAYVVSEDVDEQQYVATMLYAAERGAITLDRTDGAWTITDKAGAAGWAGLDPLTSRIAHVLGGPGSSFTAGSTDVEAGKRLTSEIGSFESSTRAWAEESGLIVRSGLGRSGWVVIAACFVAVVAVALFNPFHLTLVGLVPGLFGVFGFGIGGSGAGTRRTRAGRELWSRAGGFRRILATPSAEARFDFSGRQELYTAYIPWAVAFGCADEWAQKYRVETASEPPVPSYFGHAYAGAYAGSVASSMVDDFHSTVSSAISSYEATQRSSSSGGGGGGGFSGGGGGGGGGGGSW